MCSLFDAVLVLERRIFRVWLSAGVEAILDWSASCSYSHPHVFSCSQRMDYDVYAAGLGGQRADRVFCSIASTCRPLSKESSMWRPSIRQTCVQTVKF